MTAAAKKVEDFRKDLLVWYDRHRRVLPWRALPGQTADPYHVWLSEIMLQQTTVQAVIPYFQKFIERWPGIDDLAAAPSDEVMQAWAGLGYYARARNLHKCAIFVAETLKGVFPPGQDDLKSLPGVGDYTSAAITAIAFDRPANVVDGNVERVMARIFAVETPLREAKPILKALAAQMASGESVRPGDYAQALMDLGATICTPASPKCMICPVQNHCDAAAKGIAGSLPVKSVKAVKPKKYGRVYWIIDGQGHTLFEKRAGKGLLAGMIGLPTSSWEGSYQAVNEPDFAKNAEVTSVQIRHVFTHFELELTGFYKKLGTDTDMSEPYFWVEDKQAAALGLPTLFKKAFLQFNKHLK